MKLYEMFGNYTDFDPHEIEALQQVAQEHNREFEQETSSLVQFGPEEYSYEDQVYTTCPYSKFL